MIVEVDDTGEMSLRISGDLFALVAEHLNDDDPAAVCLFLEKLSLRKVATLENLASVDGEFAREFIANGRR